MRQGVRLALTIGLVIALMTGVAAAELGFGGGGRSSGGSGVISLLEGIVDAIQTLIDLLSGSSSG
jgi:hypothetical protein